MKYNNFGHTGLLVSELCLGTMTFGGKGYFAPIGALQQPDVNSIVKNAVDSGINFIDTANIYSDGLSEQLTGEAIRNLGLKRDDLVLATKVHGKMGEGPNNRGLTRKHIIEQADQSLKRLHVDYIDLYQIHGFDAITPFEETLYALEQLVQSGKVRYIGASNLAAWQLMKALGISETKNWSRFISLQSHYTIAGRDLEREIVPLLLDQKVGLMVWSPLAGGFLSGKYDRSGQAADGRRNAFDFPPINKDKAWDIIDVMKAIANEKGVSIAQIALSWLLHQKVVSTVIIGAKNTEQLADNVKATGVVLSEDELKKLDEISALTPEYPGWMIQMQSGTRV